MDFEEIFDNLDLEFNILKNRLRKNVYGFMEQKTYRNYQLFLMILAIFVSRKNLMWNSLKQSN